MKWNGLPSISSRATIATQMASDFENELTKLKQALSDAESINKPLQAKANEIASIAQDTRDLAQAMSFAFQSTNPSTGLGTGSGFTTGKLRTIRLLWEAQNDAARVLATEITEVASPYRHHYLLTSNTVSSTVADIPIDIQAKGTPTQATNQSSGSNAFSQLKTLSSQITLLFERQRLFDVVDAELVRVKLNVSHGANRSAQSFLLECKAAYENPSALDTSPLAVLVSIRSCIETAILDLLKRCPGQEPARTWSDKVQSIGRRCGKANLPTDYFSSLANTAEGRSNMLSGGKEKNMPRPQVLFLVNDALKFLQAFLSGVDEKRLRP